MTTEEAVRIVARYVAWALVEAEVWQQRELYPEIGEKDWARVVQRADQLAAFARPDPDAYRQAHDHLAARAKDAEATP